MEAEASSQLLFERLQSGDPAAAEEIFQRYLSRLQALARSQMTPQLRAREDEEDVVQSVYRSFFIRARDGQYRLQRSGDLWRLLATITMNKIRSKADYHGAAKRMSAAEVRENSADDSARLLSHLACNEPVAEDVVSMQEELQRVMVTLPANQRRMLELRLQGDSVEEISIAVSRSEHQVRRVLKYVREKLELRLLETSKTPSQ